ncbi:MAG TPA: carbohydrate esterase [Flavobacteriaceae bacterium]|nr:carbohydrate esterase [Flavobacteriaceae bacterium]
MLLIFTKKQTPRITYVFKQLCGNILGLETKFTSKIEEFIAHEGPKLSYGKQKMGNELFIQQTDLLFEQGFSDVEINFGKWDEVPCFFRVSEKSDLPFDIFAASFYLLSRYEEYLPYVKDKFGRFPAEESLIQKEGFLHLPLVDIWTLKFKKIVQARFPETKFLKKNFKTNTVIGVSQAYLYQKKGIVRTVGASMRDFLGFRLKSILERFKVLVFRTKDPYDVYDDLVGFSKENHVHLHFMFQLSNYSAVNKNIGYHKVKYHSLIKSMDDYGSVGLLLGNEAVVDFKQLRTEKKRFEAIVNQPLELVLNDRFDLNLPESYNNFDKIELKKDFSMGYVNNIGFRAGTSKPFLFYDLSLERISPLWVKPYVFNSKLLKNKALQEANDELMLVKQEVEKVNGEFTMIFENSDFSTENNRTKLFDLIKRIHEPA